MHSCKSGKPVKAGLIFSLVDSSAKNSFAPESSRKYFSSSGGYDRLKRWVNKLQRDFIGVFTNVLGEGGQERHGVIQSFLDRSIASEKSAPGFLPRPTRGRTLLTVPMRPAIPGHRAALRAERPRAEWRAAGRGKLPRDHLPGFQPILTRDPGSSPRLLNHPEWTRYVQSVKARQKQI